MSHHCCYLLYLLVLYSLEVEPVAEQLLLWLPFLLDHINFFISKFHSNNVALGESNKDTANVF